MDRPNHSAYSTFADDYEEETATQLTSPPPHKQTLRMGTVVPPIIPPPTPVSLPARSVNLPPPDSYAGLESLAAGPEDSASLIIDNAAGPDSESELSVVFRGAHQSERPPAPASLKLVPAPSAGRSGHPPPPPAAPPPVRAEVPSLPLPPKVPSQAPNPLEDDFDDDVDTIVLPSKAPPAADSLRPVEVRSMPPRSVAEPARAYAAEGRPPRARPPWLAMAVAGMVGAGGIAAAAFFMEEEKGDLMIDVADQQCGAVEDVKVFVDDELVCTASPCTLRVARGGHVVQAQASGYDRTEPEAVLVDPSVPTLHRIQFGNSTKTGLEVSSELKGSSLYLDGKLIGELPQRVSGLSAGEHTILISGGEGYYAEERQVTLKADEMMVLEDIKLRPKTGTLVIDDNPQLAQALVTVDGEEVELPLEAEIDASRRHHVVAKRPGYEDFETFVEFDGKSRRKELNIQLMPRESSGSSDDSRSEHFSSERSTATSRSGRTRASRSEASASTGTSESSASSAGESASTVAAKAQLTLQSSPPSNVLLDGRPIGQTPKSLSVDPGTHSILFVHPTKGKARASAKLAPGQSKTLRARF